MLFVIETERTEDIVETRNAAHRIIRAPVVSVVRARDVINLLISIFNNAKPFADDPDALERL